MFCKKCGSKLVGDEENCPYCGEPVEFQGTEENIVSQRLSILEEKEKINSISRFEGGEPTFSSIKEDKPEDPGSFWYGVLGFFIPLVGLILFCVWNKEKPKSAKQAGIGALISVILAIAFIFPCICCIIMLGTA